MFNKHTRDANTPANVKLHKQTGTIIQFNYSIIPFNIYFTSTIAIKVLEIRVGYTIRA